MPKLLIGVVIVVLLAGLIPFGLIALARSRPSTEPPIHPMQDMFRQPKFRSQRENPMFADGRAMRPIPSGTVAREDLPRPSDPVALGRLVEGLEPQADGKPGYVTRIPVQVTTDLLQRGRERFNIYCSSCHGAAGYGDGMVARRAKEMQVEGYTAPTNYHSDDLRARTPGQVFNTITHGVRSMPAHGRQIPVSDRWAIVAYVKALQRSQNARPEDVPQREWEEYLK